MNYREEVLRNCPGFTTDSIEQKLSLGGLGVAGEAAELLEVYFNPDDSYFGLGCPPEQRVKIVKEIGDVYWYLEYLCATLRTTRDECFHAIVNLPVTILYKRNIAADVSVNAGAIADIIKKVLHHEVPLDRRREEIVLKMGLTYRGLSCIGDEIGVTLDEVLEANAAKLRKQHPNGWTPASQQAKADEVL